MDELLLLERAKAYLDLLSKGIDPISGNEVQNDSALNNERLKKCFSYVCRVLQEVIDNKGKVVCISEKRPFSFSDDKKRLVMLSEEPITSAELVKRINSYVDSDTTKKLTSAPIMKWLVKNNYMAEEKIAVQAFKNIRRTTDAAAGIGLEIKRTVNKTTGEIKEEFVFSKAGQRFILDKIEVIAGI